MHAAYPAARLNRRFAWSPIDALIDIKAMVQQFISHPDDYLIWDPYDAINVPVLCLRGADSDLVLRETTSEMMRRGPGALGLTQVLEIEGCGHAPALNVPHQLELVAAFIDAVH